jgi:predicted O-methyltransferase YrrM
MDWLENNRHVWAKRSEMPGIHADVDEQVEIMRRMCMPYQAEYAGNKVHNENIKARSGPGYGYIESQCLHGVLRALKPANIVEIGSGDSTQCMLVASDMNQKEGGRASRITCVEPYPKDKLRATKGINLIEKLAQEVPLEVFTSLGEGDFIFIDSSHVVQAGSDVNYLYLEVLPRLRPGVIIHIHDIFLPFDYQRNMLKTVFFWNENSLLRALLTHNAHLRILFCMSHIFHDRPEAMKGVFPEFVKSPGENGLNPDSSIPFQAPPGHFPSSIYLQTA